MTILKIKDKEYKIKFGYNCFCDTDLIERVEALMRIMNEDEEAGISRVKELFVVVRDLIFVGFKKYNPVENIQMIGDILDDYIDESTEEDERGLMGLFEILAEELMNQGFLSNLMKQTEEAGQTA